MLIRLTALTAFSLEHLLECPTCISWMRLLHSHQVLHALLCYIFCTIPGHGLPKMDNAHPTSNTRLAHILKFNMATTELHVFSELAQLRQLKQSCKGLTRFHMYLWHTRLGPAMGMHCVWPSQEALPAPGPPPALHDYRPTSILNRWEWIMCTSVGDIMCTRWAILEACYYYY